MKMDLGLKGKKVILTGGSRGIGRAALEIFAAEGCDIAFFSRHQDQVDATVASLSRHGGNVIGEALDMTNHAAYAAWLTSAADRLGGCDIFVPGASASGSGATGDWDACFNADIKGTVIGCETLQPYLEKSGSGSIVVMSSTAGTETFIVPQAFNALKGALIVYAKQLGQALGGKGIRVNTVSPGPIAFPGGNWEAIKGAAPELYAATEAAFALGRWGGPDEVAKTIVFLSSSASSYTTGTNVVIDGGYTKRVQF
jgi:3-oxoacyl-[acyl-carrier protein] reductase